MEIHFVKASGAGNDFVLIDNRSGRLGDSPERLAQVLCARHVGIGADGLILIEKSMKADIRMMYYNADGSYGGMCGNGGRCAAAFAYALGAGGKTMSIEALDFVYRAEIVSENAVRLHMKNPQHIETGRDVSLNGHHFTVHTVDTGAPHVVLFVEDLEVQDVHETGRGLRHHAAFAPSGVNVNFVKVTGASSIALRTYERGVEAETLACGTGSVASAIISSIVQGTQNPVTIRVRSGEDLLVSFTLKDKSYYDVSLQGGALILFSGNILYDANRGIVGVASVSEL